jgi:site-specific DNA-methyltransferase (adenine-specific)
MSKSKLASAGIEDIPCADLHNDPANVRKHGDQNLAAIKASLVRFGQQKPIVVNQDGVVVAGNGTLMAARALNWTTIKAIRTNLVGSEATAFAIADNRTAELAEWDESALHQQLAAIAIDDEELLAATGFTDKDLSELDCAVNPKITEDEAPEPPANPISKLGDLWLLGKHRILCGDSTKQTDVDRLIAGARIDLLLTDPPYNVNYEGGTGMKIKNDSMPDEKFRAFLKEALTPAFKALKPGAAWYVWHADSEGFNFRAAARDCGERTRQCLIWVKNSLVLGRQDYQWQHEPCLYGAKTPQPTELTETVQREHETAIYGWTKDAAHTWNNDRKQTTVLYFDRPSKSEEHPTMKPVALFAYLMQNSTNREARVYDPFMGSGTTLMAAEQLGRIAYGMELDPRFVDVIVKRWETLTGQTATLKEV